MLSKGVATKRCDSQRKNKARRETAKDSRRYALHSFAKETQRTAMGHVAVDCEGKARRCRVMIGTAKEKLS